MSRLTLSELIDWPLVDWRQTEREMLREAREVWRLIDEDDELRAAAAVADLRRALRAATQDSEAWA